MQRVKLLNNGHVIPALGLGTWMSQPHEVCVATMHALSIGYRHIDGAWIYENEDEIGQALQASWSDKLKRDDVFITSKLWNSFHHPEDVRGAITESLKKLQLDYLDLYLIHWPMDFARGSDPFAKDKDGNFLVVDPPIPIADTWKAMEALVDAGLTKSIGFSNFTIDQIKEVLKVARIPPAVLQIEIHPYCQPTELINFCKQNGITVTAYSPLGNPSIESGDTPLNDPTIKDVANKHNKTPAQAIIRWHLDNGLVVIPKSVTPKRIEENFKVWDFNLTPKDIERFNILNKDQRVVPFKEASHMPKYPFHSKQK